MRFGHFDDAAREYVIETPRTPYPWINYLGTEEFFGLVSHTGGGYCFYRDARLRRLTRYRYNNVPTDVGGRYFYVHDGGDFWTPGWAPVKRELDSYECRVGLSYTKITGERKGIRAEVLYFVPLGTTAEVHRVTLKNTSKAAKSVKLFSFVEFCLWDAADDQNNYQRNLSIGEVEVDGSAIYHKTEYRERRNHYAVHSVNAKVAGFDTDRESFLGPVERLRRAAGRGGGEVAQLGRQRLVADRLAPARRLASPRARRRPTSSSSATSRTRWPRSGRSRASSTRSRRASCSPASRRSAQVDAALAALRDYWTEMLSKYEVTLGRRAARPDGQHLEPVPVHGDVQHVALGLLLRDRHRPRHGLPRLEPGPARLRAPRARRGRASASSTSRPPRSRTAAPTTSTSRSRSGGTTTSARASTTTRCGSSRAPRPTSRSPGTSRS